MRGPRRIFRSLSRILGGGRLRVRNARFFGEPLRMRPFRCGEITRPFGGSLLFRHYAFGCFSLQMFGVRRRASERRLPAGWRRVAPQWCEDRGKFGRILIRRTQRTKP